MEPIEVQVYQPLASPNYPRAPIIEAVIELRVVADVEARLQETVAQTLKRAYSHQQPMHTLEVVLGKVADLQTNAIRLANDDQTDILIVNARGITTARLAPYTGWTALRERSSAAWKVWRDATPGHAIERLDIRMINRIDIPASPNSEWQLEDYLLLYPSSPTLSHARMFGYMVQVSIPTFEPLWTATLTSTVLQPPPVPGHISVLLDIDISRTVDIPLHDADLWPMIDSARIIKNDLFERCITDATRKLFT